MRRFSLRKDWPLLLLLCGGALLYEFLPTYLDDRKLEGDRSALTEGDVLTYRSFRKRTGSGDRSAPFYSITYSFDVNRENYVGKVECQCDELRGIKQGDNIEIRYALANPGVNRPEIVQFNSAWLLGGSTAGVALLAVGLLLLGIRLGRDH